jgi:hypothetical protein
MSVANIKAASGRWRVQGDIFVDKKPNIG